MCMSVSLRERVRVRVRVCSPEGNSPKGNACEGSAPERAIQRTVGARLRYRGRPGRRRDPADSPRP